MTDTDDVLVAELILEKRAAEYEQDAIAVAVCGAMLDLYEAKCRTVVTMPGGERTRLPLVIAATAARMAATGHSELEWYGHLRHALADYWASPYDATVVNLIRSCMLEQRKAGLWPWG